MKNMRRWISVLIAVLIAASMLTAALASGTKEFVVTSTTHLREQPTRKSAKLATVKKGTTFVATDSKDKGKGGIWYYGSYGDAIGWVDGNCLRDPSAKPTPKPTKSATAKPTATPTPRPIDYSKFKDVNYNVIVTGNSVNMRREPSTDYGVIGVYLKDDVLKAIRSNGSWAEVVDENKNLQGYISEKYLEVCQEPKTVAPNPIEIDLEAPEDGIYSAAFTAADLTGTTLSNVHLYTADTYDIVDISTLEVGDTITIDGEDVEIKSIERDDLVHINGGLEEGGWDLKAQDESNCFVVFGLDDACTYTDHGAATLEVSEDVVFSDNALMEDRTTTGIEDVTAAIAEGEAYGYDMYNTTLRVEDGKIVEINRIYVP